MTPARVAADHGKRMGRDFYGFLGLKAGCPRDVVNRRCKHMLNRWQSAKELELDPEGERQLAQLLHGLQIVYQTLTHGERKTEYDRRLEQGHAPRVADIRQGLETALPADTSRVSVTPITPEGEGDDLDTARTLIARGAFLPATKLLERLRRKQPSSPDVLSELGWALWKAKGRAAKGENDPEDFVALALTFAPDHPKALEYHARIAFERGDHDGVRERIDRLLVVDKQNAWALEVLASDALPTSSRRTSGGGLRFWPRKSD